MLFAACVGNNASDTSVDALSSTTFKVDRIDNRADGIPSFVHGQLGRVTGSLKTIDEAHAALESQLPAIARSIALPVDQLAPKLVSQDTIGGTHVFYKQEVNGLRVVGGQVVVHIDADGQISAVRTNTRNLSNVSATPSITDTIAQESARMAVANGNSKTGAADLVYAKGRLAWEVFTTANRGVQIEKVYVDAQTGEVFQRISQVQSAKMRTTYTLNGGDVLFDGTGGRTKLGDETTPPTETFGKEAFDNTGITYDYYKNVYQRDSYDGAGAKLDSYVHLTIQGSNQNAVWYSPDKGMFYADGDNQYFGPFARSLDITAHELTHAVTETTAELEYQDESGGLNEASSDIMSAACEANHDGAVSADTWMVGEDTWTPGTPGDALRYMNDPTKDSDNPLYQGQIHSIDWYPDRITDPNTDYGGVHFNSGIANLYFYLLSEGGQHPRQKSTYINPGISIEKAAMIWEHALTQGLFMSNETFAQARTDTEQAAATLYPNQPAIKTAVSTAWASVGVGGPPPSDTTPPTVHIDTPMTGTNVQAGFAVSASATDDQGVLKLEFSVDGQVVSTTHDAPYMFSTDANLAPGSHMIAATAYDGAGNHASDSVTVTIIDPTCGNACTADQMCDMTTGTCVANPESGEGGGCCSTSGGGAGGSLLLFASTGAVLLRRRRRP